VALVTVALAVVASGNAKSTQAEPIPIKVGVLVAKSGFANAFEPGNDEAGVQISINAANGKNGFEVAGKRYKFVEVVADDQSSNQGAIAAVNHLVDDEGIKILGGAAATAYAAPGLGPLLAQKHVMFISNLPVLEFANEKTQPAFVKGPGKLIFSYAQPSTQAGYEAGRFVRVFPNWKQKIHRAYVLIQGQGDGPLTGPFIVKGLQSLGIQAKIGYYDPAATDFSGDVAKAKAFHPDLLFYGFLKPQGTAILRAAVGINAAPYYYGWAQPPADARGAATGKALTQPWAYNSAPRDLLHSGSPAIAKLGKEYLKIRPSGSLENDFPLFFYDVFPLVVKAMQAAGTVDDLDKISAELTKVKMNTPDRGPNIGFTQDHYMPIGNDACVVINSKTHCTFFPPNS
jgi:ABC-type branched-subunit amino acid transport system substrate-binding protein